MSFDNVSAGQIVAGFWILVALLGLWRWRTIMVTRRKARLAKQLALRAFDAERARVNALRQLNTQLLMQVPDKFMFKGPRICRSFGARYNRMFIVDERGSGWVGLATPELLENLRAGEYVRHDYYIPFRGAGEACAGNPVTINGMTINIYPMWMTERINLSDWTWWAQIEKKLPGSLERMELPVRLGRVEQTHGRIPSKASRIQ